MMLVPVLPPRPNRSIRRAPRTKRRHFASAQPPLASAYAFAALGVCRDGVRHATRIARLTELPGDGLLDHPERFYRRIKPERRLRSHGLQLTDAPRTRFSLPS